MCALRRLYRRYLPHITTVAASLLRSIFGKHVVTLVRLHVWMPMTWMMSIIHLKYSRIVRHCSPRVNWTILNGSCICQSCPELLASRLHEKWLLDHGTRVTFYRNREAELRRLFQSDGNLVYCSEVAGLLLAMGLPAYDAGEWRLFIDTSKSSLKCVLLHNGNRYASIPVGYSVRMREEYAKIKTVWRGYNIRYMDGKYASTSKW